MIEGKGYSASLGQDAFKPWHPTAFCSVLLCSSIQCMHYRWPNTQLLCQSMACAPFESSNNYH